jgi:2-phosphoglycerate kinase
MRLIAACDQTRTLHLRQLELGDELLQQRQGVIVCLCGTAGTGKSTLASLLGQRLGVATIVSTDSIRHMLR